MNGAQISSKKAKSGFRSGRLYSEAISILLREAQWQSKSTSLILLPERLKKSTKHLLTAVRLKKAQLKEHTNLIQAQKICHAYLIAEKVSLKSPKQS